MKKPSGFTLVELMVTLMIAAIILSIGVPSFTTMVRSNRIAAMTNQLVSALNLARSEAIKRTETVTFCSTTNGAICAASTNWQTGWLVLDANNNVLRSWDALSGNTTLTGSATQIQYLSSGFVNSAETFQLRADGCTDGEGRDIAVSVTGRPSVTNVDCS